MSVIHSARPGGIIEIFFLISTHTMTLDRYNPGTDHEGILYYNTVELQWLEHLWNHENMFETGVVGAGEC